MNPQSPQSSDSPDTSLPLSRRRFVQLAGLAGLAAVLPRMNALASPVDFGDFSPFLPRDKRLDPAWVRSLFERGERTFYRGGELKWIGMPVGGICAGQLYLGGDGKLWHWDIFNQRIHTEDEHYAAPLTPASPLDQGFVIAVGSGEAMQARTLDAKGFRDVRFNGEYPFGFVEYRDDECPVRVSLEAFSPFIPLNTNDSSLPATVMRYTVQNPTQSPVDVELRGFLENVVGTFSGSAIRARGRHNRIIRTENLLALECSNEVRDPAVVASERPGILFADFEGDDYGAWKTEGDAFGSGPMTGNLDTPGATFVGNYQGKKVASSLKDAHDRFTGKLTSPEFTIERAFITFLVAGGRRDSLAVNLLIDGQIVRHSTGNDAQTMTPVAWDVREFEGRRASIQIIDDFSGGWGHIVVDHIQFEDNPSLAPFSGMSDAGTMTLCLLNPEAGDTETANLQDTTDSADAPEDPHGKLIGALTRKFTIPPGENRTVTFLLTWHFVNLCEKIDGNVLEHRQRHYGTLFHDALEVAQYVAGNFERLYGQTKLWRDTWEDSTLPHWLLDRTFLNASILATSTAYRLSNGRFWGWEGVGSCAGTCTHVWGYEQTMGRLFPELDRALRERVDFNPAIAFHPDTGVVGYRGEDDRPATDGQANVILRTYRDHQTSADDAFLKRNWEAIKKATEWLINEDGNGDGIIEGKQPNTQDGDWWGAVPWLSGLYLAALRAAEEMAQDVGDQDFAKRCRAIFETGQRSFVDKMWDARAGYFVQIADPAHRDSVGSYNGCEAEQVFGQSWANQVGLGRVLPEKETRAALRSIWRYNFSPDAGGYLKEQGSGRVFATPGEAGLLICTWPQGKPANWGEGVAAYFNECWNGIEHEVASQMIAEGLVQEGLAIERALHDRYHAARRNPWNEVECGDHYSRSMASLGVFVAACGFEYHGPRGYLAFAPKLSTAHFKAAFVGAEGWGSYQQEITVGKMESEVTVKWGQLRLKTLGLTWAGQEKVTSAKVTAGDRNIPVTVAAQNGKITLRLGEEVTLKTGETLKVTLE